MPFTKRGLQPWERRHPGGFSRKDTTIELEAGWKPALPGCAWYGTSYQYAP
jgi:hypothetical protein